VTIYLVAILIVVAVGLFVAAPLSSGFSRRRAGRSELEIERLEHERGLAMQGLRELEFDHEMGKLEEADYHNLRQVLEERALKAMGALEKLKSQTRTSQLRAVPRRLHTAGAAAGSAERRFNFCPQCGVRVAAGYHFCAQCGAALEQQARSASRAE
jgi:cytochrome c-type biogenesis protein CcmI